MPNTSHMTPLQLKRHLAAVKAAATKRANAARAAGHHVPFTQPPPRPAAPPPPPPPSGWAGGTSGWAPRPAGSPRPSPPPPFTQAPPAPPPAPATPRPGQAFSTPKPTVKNQRLEVVAQLENLFVLVCRDSGLGVGTHTKGGCCAAHDEMRKTFDTYKKTLNRAIAPSVNSATQNEADTALRLAAVALLKLTF